MKRMFIMAAACLVLTSLCLAGQQRGRQLSPQQTDQAINDIFNGAAGVVRMETDLITQKSGGMSKNEQTSFEFLRLETPTRMVLQNRGNNRERVPIEETTLIIVDGRNIWEVEGRRDGATERQVSRRAFRPNLEGNQAQGLAIFIGLFLMGRDVTSASDIRQNFDIACYEEQIPNRQETTLH